MNLKALEARIAALEAKDAAESMGDCIMYRAYSASEAERIKREHEERYANRRYVMIRIVEPGENGGPHPDDADP